MTDILNKLDLQSEDKVETLANYSSDVQILVQPVDQGLTTTSVPHYGLLDFPHDITSLLFTDYLSHHTHALSSLSMTCRRLNYECRPLVFRTIVIGIPSDASSTLPYHPVYNDIPVQTSLMRLVDILTASPDIVEYIHDLSIFKTGLSATKTSKLDPADGELLKNLFTRNMENLRRLEISLDLHWPSMPEPVKQSYQEIFALPKLREVILDTFGVPTYLLGYPPQSVETLDIRGSFHTSREIEITTFPHVISPKKLVLKGRRLFIDIAQSLFGDPVEPVQYSALEVLHIYGHGGELDYVTTAFEKHDSASLKTLRLCVNEWGLAPQTFDASPFCNLTTIELGIECGRGTNILAHQILSRFLWLSKTLATLPDDIPIEIVHLTIGFTVTAYLSFRDVPWSLIDDVFSFSERAKGRWRCLKKVKITPCDQDSIQHMRELVHKGERLEEDTYVVWLRNFEMGLPNLTQLGVLDIENRRFEDSMLAV